MPIFLKCCLCAKLETGGYIIGTIGFIYGIYFLNSSIQGTVKIVDESGTVDKDHLWILLIVAAYIVLLAPNLLIVGTRRRDSRCIAVWLALDILSLVINVVCYSVKGWIIVLVIVTIQLYFWICVYSLYQMLRDERSLFPIITIPRKSEAPTNFTETFLTKVPDQPCDYCAIP